MVTTDRGVVERVFQNIDQDELTELAVAMGNIYAPIGREKPMADFLEDWLRRNGLEAKRVVVAPERDNVVSTLYGIGGGRSIVFNAHMDSDRSVAENIWITPNPERAYPCAWVDGDKIFGRAVLNDRGCMACFMIAVKALKESGVRLKGNVIQTMVVGETDQAPVDEFQGPEYCGNGFGTKFLLEHGLAADYAVVAETTDWSPVWAECGLVFFKVTVFGQAVYTPRSVRPDKIEDNQNAVVKMAHLILKLDEWGRRYEEANTRDTPLGLMVPKVSVNCVRGGQPYRAALSAGVCSAYVDVRVLPETPIVEVEREFRGFVDSLGLGARVEVYNSRRGYVARNIEPLLDAIAAAHKLVMGTDPGQASVEERSMWRDINLFNEWGIPALTYGPPRRVLQDGVVNGRLAATTDDGGKVKYFLKDDLVRTARIYALTALEICGVAE